MEKIYKTQESYLVKSFLTNTYVPAGFLAEALRVRLGWDWRLAKSEKKTKDIPIIIFSANTEIEHASERTNADGFLKKPFEVKNLLSIVE